MLIQRAERLPDQLEGVGYTVKAYLDVLTLWKIDYLLQKSLYGRTHEDVAERTLSDWLWSSSGFENLGISWDDAVERGYAPIKFKPKLIKKEKRELDPSQPLLIEVYGFPAYTLDELARKNLFGGDREEIVRVGITSGLTTKLGLLA